MEQIIKNKKKKVTKSVYFHNNKEFIDIIIKII